MENRYKDIMQENRFIKDELADLRKNQKINTGKVVLSDSANMPLRKNQDDRYLAHSPLIAGASSSVYMQDEGNNLKRSV